MQEVSLVFGPPALSKDLWDREASQVASSRSDRGSIKLLDWEAPPDLEKKLAAKYGFGRKELLASLFGFTQLMQ